ncbi:autotransporter outer membrane beta-barrel domain-containing protein [Fischerella muscicola CCMEE 5323]|uniref:Autotransporter outer membrane beta-barrel domain-containing protein n=1 Tax=Fischerella muscicola CCMEE 5323 TaxID=2019572 RepID=A0A2N6JZ52_FISMU|nr:autotransporter domain-containing protein [Fischerella sp. FACHB-380]PLZ86574.1 autotransporter outer membrane beta-barrel domain-containing protein [Fischerella muscicola CCMEE 5323]
MSKEIPVAIAFSVVSNLLPFKALAGDYEQLFIFGDSLSDNGNLYRLTGGTIPLSPPYFQGRFSNGPVWVEILGSYFNIDANETTNYAVGGSTSGNTNVLSESLIIPLPALSSQINNFTSAPVTPSSNALFILWAGANDYLIQPIEKRATNTQVVVNNLSNAITILINKGARNIIVPNLPDLGKTPQERSLGTADSTTTLIKSHNSNLNTALQEIARTRNVNIIPLDIHALFDEVIDQPDRYGLTNINDPCFDQQAGTICSNPDEYLFWDNVHPTDRGHKFIAEYTEAVLNAPVAIVPQAEIALHVAQRQAQLIDDRLSALQNPSHTQSTDRWGVFVNGDVNLGSQDASEHHPDYDYKTGSATVGVDYSVTDKLAVGVALGVVNNETELHQNQSDIEIDGYAVSVYSNYVQNNFYTNAVISYGNNDFDIQRQIDFDHRTATAKTDGTQFSVNLNSGYIARSGNISYGPTLGLKYDRININGYTETGAGSLNIKVDDQQAESFIVSVGTQAAVELKTSFGSVIPNIHASYEYQFAPTHRTITTELVTQPGIPMRTQTSEPDRDYFKLSAGTQILFSQNFAGTINYEIMIGREDVSNNTIKGEIRYQF